MTLSRRAASMLVSVVAIALLAGLALCLWKVNAARHPSIIDEAVAGTGPCTTTDLLRKPNSEGRLAIVRTASCYSFESVWYYVVILENQGEPNREQEVALMYEPEDSSDLGKGSSRPSLTWTGSSSLDITVRGPIASPMLQKSSINGVSIHYSLGDHVP